MSKTQETTLEINLNNLKHNFEFLKSKISPKTKFLAVVKAFAYGSDAEVIAKHLEALNVDYFAVAYVSEGVQLRKCGIEKPILVLHPQTTNFKELINHCLEPNLYSFRVLKEFTTLADTLKLKHYPVHIKFNTGLNRIGFKDSDVQELLKITNCSKSVKISSIFSHLAASEDHDEQKFTKNQIFNFEKIKKQFDDNSIHKPFAHLCNTSGILNFPEAHLDMVRAGIGLYGFGNEPVYNNKLKPVAALKSIISQIRNVEKGESIGYNRAFVADTKIKLAVIPLGHADGISRQYGNGNGFVFIKNKKAPIIGNVCMDMIMVDVTKIDCNETDEVVIFNSTYPASNLSNTINTISYEIITGITNRIKRKIVL